MYIFMFMQLHGSKTSYTLSHAPEVQAGQSGTTTTLSFVTSAE